MKSPAAMLICGSLGCARDDVGAKAGRYSEVWRGEVERWLDEEYVKRGVDPAVSKGASEALLNELELTTAAESREAWERLMGIMQKGEGEDSAKQ